MTRTTTMMNLNDMQFMPIIMKSDRKSIETNKGMSVKAMVRTMARWSWRNTILKVFDVKFKNRHPHSFRMVGFTDYHDRCKDEFVEFMFSVSLTHKVMFVDKCGNIFITESANGQTNIDADLIDVMLNAYR